jgi:prepilin-type N-terminal cleavage/methylation domain-containing protein
MNDSHTYSGSADEGFTLTELMVAVSVLVIVISAAMMAIAAVNIVTDRLFAVSAANTASSNTLETVAADVRRAWNPDDGPLYAFRTRTASQCTFYIGGGADGKVYLVTYQASADATGGTYSMTRTLAATTSPVDVTNVASDTVFATTSVKKVGKGLTSNSVFQYFQQAAGLPVATTTGWPSAVQITIADKVKVGSVTAASSNTGLVQLRTLYDYDTH